MAHCHCRAYTKGTKASHCSIVLQACLLNIRCLQTHGVHISRVLHFFPEQQTGFRGRRCTADSIGDVVTTLGQARSEEETALLVLLDVQSAFDGLPHVVVMHALDALGVSGRMGHFVRAFLSGRSFCVRVGNAQSSPQPVTAGVPQGSVLSPFLLNVALARLSSTIPKRRHFPVYFSLHAPDIALWTSGPRRNLAAALDLPPGGHGRLGGSPCFRGPLGIPRQDQGPPGTSPLGHPTERCLSHHRWHQDTMAEDTHIPRVAD
ncbi:hypothetical protein HPB49_003854 [Dermacentor silvarum]|uniref:Uncharacterized protein n=1 Tax=Dermacentor silvarum TaxID=543639 RepID=A0ACB8CD89_DERSI|nr:hypothetical protein HPB49_003854 [Dermacentor silvarum]